MRIIIVFLSLWLVGAGFADTLKLRSGRVVSGTYLGGTARQIRMEVGEKIEAFDVSDVSSLEFSGPASAPAASAPAPAAVAAPDSGGFKANSADSGSGNILRPAPGAQPAAQPPSAGTGVELAAGTTLTVRMIDSVDSENNSVGQTFNASLDEPVIVNGETVIPRGADAVIKLVDDQESGKLVGHTVLTLDLISVKVSGRAVDVNAQSVDRSSSSRGARTAKVATGGAALGAIIGAIAGGGKGAAVGAAAGAGAGAATGVITKGQRVHIPSETRLTFTLDTAVKI